MTKVDIDGIISKIQKLSAMADAKGGATENEMAMATAAIKKLLALHNLSMADCDTKSNNLTGDVTEQTGVVSNSFGEYNRILMWAVSYTCEVRFYYTIGFRKDGQRKKVPMFVGKQSDISIAIKLYEALRLTVCRMAYEYKEGCRDSGIHASYSSYRVGVAHRLMIRSKEETKMDTPQQQEKYGALVVCKQKNIRDFMDTKGLNKSKTRRQTRVHGASYQQGMQDGNNVSMAARTTITK